MPISSHLCLLLTTLLPTSLFAVLILFWPWITLTVYAYQFGPQGKLTVNQAQGRRMRRYITSFVKHGDPSITTLEADLSFHPWRNKEQAMTFGEVKPLFLLDDFYGMRPDTLNATQCDFWGYAPYWAGPDKVYRKGLSSNRMRNSIKDCDENGQELVGERNRA